MAIFSRIPRHSTDEVGTAPRQVSVPASRRWKGRLRWQEEAWRRQRWQKQKAQLSPRVPDFMIGKATHDDKSNRICFDYQKKSCTNTVTRTCA